jgi:hypothetical protein
VSGQLDKLTQAERMLAEVANVEDAQNVIDFAEAARVFARQAKLGTSAVNHATTVKLRAERRLADMVDEGQRTGAIAAHGGDRKSSFPGGSLIPTPKTLGELDISYKKLAEARVIRDTFSEEDLLARAAEADQRDRELSRKDLVKQAVREKRIREKRERVEEIQGTEPVPLADYATGKQHKFRWVVAPNTRRNGSCYDTVSIAVPTEILQKAITKAMTISWAGSAVADENGEWPEPRRPPDWAA